ncbi:MAG: hypothetical protein ACM3U0_01210 [archaeon]
MPGKSLFYFLIVFATYGLFLCGCRKDAPTMPGREFPYTNLLSLTAYDSTLNYIRLRLITSSRYPGPGKVMLFRIADDSTSEELLISEYPLANKDTIIVDNNYGKGLLIGHEYKYRAMIIDPVKAINYLAQEVTARTLSLTSDDYIWTEYTFGEFQSQLHGVWAASENDVYAIGPIVSQGKEYGGMHFDGNKWEIIKDAGGYSAFGFSASDVWAAGGFLFHFDGSKWIRYGSKIVGDHVEILDTVLFTHGSYLALWGTSGSNLYLGDEGGYIVHWDGRKAHLEDIRASVPIRDIWGISSSEIYVAAGDYIAGIGELYRFDGSSWKMIKKGVVFPGHGELTQPFLTVWTYNGEEIITGGNYVARGTGDKWNESGIGFFVHKIRGDKPNNIFASGSYGIMAHFNGNKWTMVNSGINGKVYLEGIFVKDDYIYVVGTDGYKAYIYHGKRR